MEDIFVNARDCISKNVIESLFSSPGCHWRNEQFVTRSPLNPNKDIEGFEINESGLWHDFRSDEGGDLIDLVSIFDRARIVLKLPRRWTVVNAESSNGLL